MIKYNYEKIKEVIIMKKYVITVTLANGQTVTRVIANKHLALHLMNLFIKHNEVTNVRIKTVLSKED